MDGELIHIGGGAEGEPGRSANWEGLVEAGRKSGEEGRVIRSGGGRVNPQQGDRPVRVDLGRKGERKGAVGGPKDLCRNIWEGGSYCVPIWVRGVGLPGCVESPGSCREGGRPRGG